MTKRKSPPKNKADLTPFSGHQASTTTRLTTPEILDRAVGFDWALFQVAPDYLAIAQHNLSEQEVPPTGYELFQIFGSIVLSFYRSWRLTTADLWASLPDAVHAQWLEFGRQMRNKHLEIFPLTPQTPKMPKEVAKITQGDQIQLDKLRPGKGASEASQSSMDSAVKAGQPAGGDTTDEPTGNPCTYGNGFGASGLNSCVGEFPPTHAIGPSSEAHMQMTSSAMYQMSTAYPQPPIWGPTSEEVAHGYGTLDNAEYQRVNFTNYHSGQEVMGYHARHEIREPMDLSYRQHTFEAPSTPRSALTEVGYQDLPYSDRELMFWEYGRWTQDQSGIPAYTFDTLPISHLLRRSATVQRNS